MAKGPWMAKPQNSSGSWVAGAAGLLRLLM